MDLLLVGAGGHARSCIDVIEMDGGYVIRGLIGSRDEIGKKILGYPVIGTDTELPELLSKYPSALVTVGQIKSPETRMRLFDLVEQSGSVVLPTIVSPRAYVSKHAELGVGTIVMHGAVVNAGASVGRNCIVNSFALIEHDVVVEDHCHISTACIVNGGSRVGTGTFIGSNASVREGVQIGNRCLIGMGQRIYSDIADEVRIPSVRPQT